MTDEEIRKIVSDTVAETLMKLGIAADDPLEVQKDMQHLRAWRGSVETVKRQSLLSAVGLMTAGILGLVWVAIKGTTPH